MKSLHGSQVLMLLGALVAIAIAGFFFTKIFQALPSEVPGLSSALSEPQTIGIIAFRQQAEAVKGFKDEIQRLGYTAVTYKEMLIPSDDTMFEQSAAATRALVGEKVDVIYTVLEFMALAAINTTKEMGDATPIVFMAEFHDPISYGLAKSYRSSENNATGVSISIVETVQKQLEFLKKIRPDAKKIGVFGKGFMVPPLSGDEFYPELKRQAAKFGYAIVEYTTDVPPPQAGQAWNDAAAAIKPGDIDALYHFAGHYYDPQEAAESALAIRLQIPMIAPLEDLPNGGQFGYSADYISVGGQSARIVDKILRGGAPSDIPIENAEKLTLVVNAARAKAARVAFPESLLSIATIVDDK